jgi:hypothetical protein
MSPTHPCALIGLCGIGAAASDQRNHWHARLQLEETEIVWDKPIEPRMKADVVVQDTRPFVALITLEHLS